jgi:O-antigen/teichoic acid export membrane protein
LIRRNIVIGILAQGMLLLLSLVATRLVFHELGGEVLGLLSFAVALTFLFITLSDMGLSVFITREVAAHRKHDRQYVQELVGTAAAFSWVTFLVSAAIVLLLAPWLVNQWLRMDVTDPEAATTALRLIGASLLLAIPRAVYGSVLSGFERVDLWNVANLVAVAIQQLGLILVLAGGGGLLAIAGWFCVSAVLGFLPFLYFVQRVGGRELLWPAWTLAPLLRNLRFASHLFASSLAGFLVTQIDKWAISRFLHVSLLGYYSFAQGLVSKGGIVTGAIANAAFPAFSTGVGVPGDDAWRPRYRRLQEFTYYVYFPVIAAVAMLGVVVTRLVFNREIAEMLWVPLVLLAVGQYLLGLTSVPQWLAIAVKRPDISLRSNLWALVLVLPLTVALVYRFGLLGAAASTVLYAVWQLFYFIPRFCFQCLGMRASLWYLQAGYYFAIGLAAYGLPWLGAWMLGEGLSFTGLVAAYILGTFVFLLAGWFRTGPDLRASLLHSMRALRMV